MTLAFDAFTHLYTGNGTAHGGTHTPTGTPRAVIVTISQNATTSDNVTSVTYGGVTMTRAIRVTHSSSIPGQSPGAEYIYFLGASIPTGAQTVTVNQSAGSWHTIDCFTYTAAADTEVQNTGSLTGDGDDPSTSLALSSKTCAVVMGGRSGGYNTGQITPLSGWTSRYEYDYGDDTGFTYSYNTIAASDVTWGLTTYAANSLAAAIAIKEIAAETFIPRIISL